MRRLSVSSVACALVLAGCGGSDSPAPATDAAETPPPEPVTLELKKLSKKTTDSSLEVQGTVTADSRVMVNGKRAKVRGERFRISLPLDIGKNRIRVVASKPSFEEAQERALVTRSRAPVTAAEDTLTTETAPDAEPEPQLEPCTYGPESLCTPEENEREGQAEALCGPGTAEGRREAAEQGIQC